MKRALALALSFAAVVAVAFAIVKILRMPRLPLDGMQALRSGAWQEYGGLWSEENGVFFNRSDELGSKIVTGSSSWSDYKVDADIRLLGHHGEVGLVVRADKVGNGINSYLGYYTGFRSLDNSLTLGYSDYDWMEKQPVPLQSHLFVSDWMHIHVVVLGCTVAAELTVLRTREQVRSVLRNDRCVPRGRIGLRSLSEGAAWRNVLVSRASQADLDAITRMAPPAERAVYPTREDDLVHMLMAEPAKPDRFFADYTRDRKDGSELNGLPSAQPIASLSTSRTSEQPATLQGVVTHIDPVYIQDTTGGIALHAENEGILNLGDEVEVIGKVTRSVGRGDSFHATSLRVLWDGTSPRPVSVTSGQAASGLFDGSLIELSGKLLDREVSPNGRIRLRMSSGREEFSVVVQQSLSHRSARMWEIGSTLRVRGVCAVNPEDAPPSDLFQILPRSVADIVVVAGPPWSSGIRLAALIFAGVLLLGGAVYVYLQVERWKMRAIYEERERLAADMHDTLAQGFAGVGYQLQSLRRGLRENASIPEHLMRRLDTACELATDTHRDASTRITALHFAADEEYDVLDILERSTTLMLGSESTLQVSREHVGSPRFISIASRDALFRIGHEAIANVLRHSRANSMLLRLMYEDRSVRLEVVDDGIGFEEGSSSGFGISSMRGRAEEIGGRFVTRSKPGEGTTVSVEVPYRQRANLLSKMRDRLARMFGRKPSRAE